MSALDSSAAVAVSYAAVPVSDRVLSLVGDCPLGAMAVLTGFLRQREGGPLNVVVRLAAEPNTDYCIAIFHHPENPPL
jgi:hypothetical protein